MNGMQRHPSLSNLTSIRNINSGTIIFLCLSKTNSRVREAGQLQTATINPYDGTLVNYCHAMVDDATIKSCTIDGAMGVARCTLSAFPPKNAATRTKRDWCPIEYGNGRMLCKVLHSSPSSPVELRSRSFFSRASSESEANLYSELRGQGALERAKGARVPTSKA
ncbi:uncharacterized protein EI90DRAFT_1639830 [Cantharellus anzutake]|uniref:uncharacterized protein n=1 Tax=Cantharellus anzutake TaxID=1750568 RepID=UPI0019036E8C|nr:uncharacterized protein EI90DRAFT_1639830 [Cantharellus anzutake]KAF8327889.1 hypothetical protein EI90DRAFT_1639830 [Cantharellus anzutake]